MNFHKSTLIDYAKHIAITGDIYINMQGLGIGQWQIFGAHGFKKDYSVTA